MCALRQARVSIVHSLALHQSGLTIESDALTLEELTNGGFATTERALGLLVFALFPALLPILRPRCA